MKKITLLLICLITINSVAQELNYMENEVLVQLKRQADPSMLESESFNFEIDHIELVSRPLNI